MRSRTVRKTSTSSRSSSNTDRRQRNRLRDLCDEVLASFRLAAGQEPISEQDRQAAQELMRGVAPLGKLAH